MEKSCTKTDIVISKGWGIAGIIDQELHNRQILEGKQWESAVSCSLLQFK